MIMLIAASSSSACRTTPWNGGSTAIGSSMILGRRRDRVAGEESSATDHEPERDGLVADREDLVPRVAVCDMPSVADPGVLGRLSADIEGLEVLFEGFRAAPFEPALDDRPRHGRVEPHHDRDRPVRGRVLVDRLAEHAAGHRREREPERVGEGARKGGGVEEDRAVRDELGAADIDRFFVEGDEQVDLGFHRRDRLPRGADRRVGVTAADSGQDVPVGVDVQVLRPEVAAEEVRDREGPVAPLAPDGGQPGR